jgi:Uma2 family endonuclease
MVKLPPHEHSEKDKNMSSVLKQNRLTHEEYFALEQVKDQRYEYIAGEVFAMAGGTESHALIGANIIIDLGYALRGKPCRVYTSDMKLYVRDFDKFCYPDVQVLCEQGIRHEKYVENPLIVVEVLSESTEAYDRNKKFEHYRSIATLKYYVLVDQTYKHVELYEKETTDRWIVTYPRDQLMFQDLNIALDIEDIYRQVEFANLDSRS